MLKKFLPDAQGHIDKNKAMDNFADETLYKEVLQTFADTADDKIKNIEKALEASAWKDYVIFVHALKSNAKSIGAEELGEKARRLEEIGKRLFDKKATPEDERVVREDTPWVLDLYKQTAEEAKKRVLC